MDRGADTAFRVIIYPDGVDRADICTVAAPPAILPDDRLTVIHVDGINKTDIFGTQPAPVAIFRDINLDSRHLFHLLLQLWRKIRQEFKQAAAGAAIADRH